MVGIVHSSFTLVVTSYRLLISFLACIGLGSVIVLGAVLAYKGRALASIALLYFAGLSIEWLSVQYWQGTFWLVGPLMDVYPWFPLLPIIAGTLPGVLAALAALAQAWELFAHSATPPLQELTGQRGGQK